MRTTSFKSVLEGVAHLIGQDPEVDFQVNLARALGVYADLRIRQCWRFFDFPELMVLEERFYRLDWSSGTTYAIGDEVYYPAEEKYYISLLGANLNQNPVTATTYWAEAEDLDKYIAYEQTGFTKIGTVAEAWTENPRVSTTAKKLDFELSENGVQFHPDAQDSVWLYYKARPSQLSGAAWSSDTTYALDDVRYLPATGLCYLSLQGSNTNQNPASQSAYWRVQPVPYVLSVALQRWIYADWLKSEGQIDKFGAEKEEAEEALQQEVDELGTQGNAATYGVRI